MTGDVKLSRYNISDEILGELTADQRAIFAILSLTLSEVLAMQKILALGPSGPIGDDELDEALLSQKTVFMRMIAMKIYEVFQTLMLSGAENKSHDDSLIKFRNDCVQKEFNKLKKVNGYERVRTQRNRMGSHYDLKHFRKLVERRGTRADHAVLFAETFEFQSFPYGEIVVASGLGDIDQPFSKGKAQDELKTQSEFIVQATRSFSAVFQAFFCDFLEHRLILTETPKAVPTSLQAVRNDTSFPLFLYPETTK